MSKRGSRTGLPQQKPSVGVARLHGREKDIALVDRLIERIDQGGSALVISGEPGIEKSALLEVAKHRARARGFFHTKHDRRSDRGTFAVCC
jgi:hypothetical protein